MRQRAYLFWGGFGVVRPKRPAHWPNGTLRDSAPKLIDAFAQWNQGGMGNAGFISAIESAIA